MKDRLYICMRRSQLYLYANSAALTINLKILTATHNHSLPRVPDCVKLSDLEMTFGNYIPNSILISF